MKNQEKILTLNKIREKKPCESGWKILLRSLKCGSGWRILLQSSRKEEIDDTEVSINHLLESNGVDDTLWIIMNCIEGEIDKKSNMLKEFVESAVKHAERVLPTFEKERPDNERPRRAIEKTKDLIESNFNVLAKQVVRVAAVNAENAAKEIENSEDIKMVRAARAARAVAWAARAATMDIIEDDRAGKATEVTRATEAARAAARAAASVSGDISGDSTWDAGTLETENQKKIILKYFGE